MEFPKSFFFSFYKPVTLAKYVEKLGKHAAIMKTEEISTEFLSKNYMRTEHSRALVLD